MKEDKFSQKHKKIHSNFIQIFILKPWCFPLGCIKLNKTFEKLWSNKSREQVLLNLTSQYGVQKYFFIKKFNEIDLCEVER